MSGILRNLRMEGWRDSTDWGIGTLQVKVHLSSTMPSKDLTFASAETFFPAEVMQQQLCWWRSQSLTLGKCRQSTEPTKMPVSPREFAFIYIDLTKSGRVWEELVPRRD